MNLSLQGKLLIAMPGMVDTTFSGSVVFLCAHSNEGAMGLIINKPLAGASFLELAGRLDLDLAVPDTRERLEQMPILMGGPVDAHRGFVLHSDDYVTEDGSMEVMAGIKLSATMDVLRDMVLDRGPLRTALALGYASWSPGQLENEILRNGWLHCEADSVLLFAPDWPSKYNMALAKLGISPAQLSSVAGHS
jgi:putative transcriptional regulator